MRTIHHRCHQLLILFVLLGGAIHGFAAGLLQPLQSGDLPLQIQDHHVRVVINNGYAQTTVTQVFFNPNPLDLEAIYSFPLPVSASLSEVTILSGEQELHGEVVSREEANRIYETERDRGNDAGVANKEGYQSFEFKVSQVRAQQSVTIRFVYYQPLAIDLGICRYLYPLEEGGTDDEADNFWHRNDKVEQALRFEVEIKSAWPLTDLRIPHYGNAAVIDKVSDQHVRAQMEIKNARLDRDLVVYYRLADELPGRVEMLAYRNSEDEAGTFMMVLTPGIDLQPLTQGADYVFVLDISGSMSGKIATLAEAVNRALGVLRPQDTFRVVTFNDRGRELISRRNATKENVQIALATIKGIQVSGGTNLYDGIKLGLHKIDADRATSLILVTDGVTNTGELSPVAFRKLMTQYDIRVFGFLMGNSANWPLMRLICESSGGFYAGISNNDDIIGQLLLAKEKVTHEALHDATLSIRGGDTFDTSAELLGKVYRGQQLVFFGRYRHPGPATVTLKARLTGEDKTYQTSFNFPAIDTDNPELERLWALHRIEMLESKRDAGLEVPAEANNAIRDLGIQYQLVSDETSMLVLSDRTFKDHGIERRNQERVAREHQAQSVRSQQAPTNHRVDQQQPAFNHKAARPRSGGGGGGAIDPFTGILMLLTSLGAAIGFARRKPHA